MRIQVGNEEIWLHEIENGSFGCYLWSAALVLTLYLHLNKEKFSKARILELGAGLGLCGLYLGKLDCKVVLTDSGAYSNVLDNLKSMVRMNSLKNTTVEEITWGVIDDRSKAILDGPFDYIIGSDVFYEPKDFEDLIASIWYSLSKSPTAVFLTSYQERISSRCIDILLDRWGLVAKQIEFYEPTAIFECMATHINVYSGKSSDIKATSTWDNADLSSVFLIEFRLKEIDKKV